MIASREQLRFSYRGVNPQTFQWPDRNPAGRQLLVSESKWQQARLIPTSGINDA